MLKNDKRFSRRGGKEPRGCERLPDTVGSLPACCPTTGWQGGAAGPHPEGTPLCCLTGSPFPQLALRQRRWLLGGETARHSCCAVIRFAQLSEAVKANGGFGKDAVQPGRNYCLGWLVRQSWSCCRLGAARKVDVRSQSVSQSDSDLSRPGKQPRGRGRAGGRPEGRQPMTLAAPCNCSCDDVV